MEFYQIDNAWYGTTCDGTLSTKNNIDDLIMYIQLCSSTRFVSFEPLLAPVDPDLRGISWIIIGADSNLGAVKPPQEWADHLIAVARREKIPVFIKDNYGYPERIKEMPKA